MSAGNKLDQGRPNAANEEGYLLFMYCGGKGAGGCLTPLGITKTSFAYRVPKYITANRRVIIQNNGVRLFNDGGPDGFGCPNSQGLIEKSFYMALSVDGNLTDAQVVAQGVRLSGALPYNVEFSALKIPQPSNPLWSNQLFVQLYWGDPTVINQTGNPITSSMMAITKHEYDIKQ